MVELARAARREYLPGKVVSFGEPSEENGAFICAGELCLALSRQRKNSSNP